jgi:hypothetical protein
MTDPLVGNEIGCTVLIDGQPINDGCVSLDPSVPTVLSGLKVRWGRSTTVDQPAPSTCNFEIIDPLSGPRIIPKLTIGRQVDVRVDTVVYPDPDVSVNPTMYPTNVANAKSWVVTPDGKTMTVIGYEGAPYSGRQIGYYLPPLPYSDNPLAWDAVPRALPGQNWKATLRWTRPDAFAGWPLWEAEFAPAYYVNPNGHEVEFGPWTRMTISGALVTATFTPPPGRWIGMAVHIYPVSPTWAGLGPTNNTSWDQLAGLATRTNRAVNPRAVASGTACWLSSWGFGAGGAGTYSDATGIAGPPSTGITTAKRKTWTTAPTTNTDSGMNIVGAPGQYIPVTPGETLTLSIWARKTSAGSKGLNLWSRFKDQVTISGSTTVTPNPPNGPTVPMVTNGQWYRATQTITAPPGAVAITVIADIDPLSGDTLWAPGETLEMTGLLIEPGPGPAGPFFDGATPDTRIDYAWTGAANASISTGKDSYGKAQSWDDIDTFVLADMQVLAPAAGAAESAYVFSGRITDVIARWDGIGDPIVQVIAQDWLAELANRFVGDEPWAIEGIAARANRIVQLSKQPITLHVDPGIGGLPVSYRDVDRQPAAGLLQQLATSAGGALWTATHMITGQIMKIEDIGARPAALTLEADVPGGPYVRVTPSAEALAHGLPVSSCEIDVDPVRFILDTSSTVSMVALQWLDQVVNEDGKQTPKQLTVEVIDGNMMETIGARRLSVSTQLAYLEYAQAQAVGWLARNSSLAWRIENLVWDTTGHMTPDEVKTVLHLLDGTTRIGQPLALTDLPEWTHPLAGDTGAVALYLEGGTYRYNAGSWELELDTSSATSSAVGTFPWTASEPDWSWDDFDPNMSWLDLYGVTYPEV